MRRPTLETNFVSPNPSIVAHACRGRTLRATVWEFNLSTWSGEQRQFDIYIDDVGVKKKQ